MVFLRRDQQEHSVPHLDTTQRGDTHVEEDAKQSSHGNHLQNRLHVNRNTWKSQRGSDCYKRKGKKRVALSALEQQMAALTNHDGHKNATDPLLNHLLDLWFRALGHDGQSIGVGDRTHGGSTQPGHAEN